MLLFGFLFLLTTNFPNMKSESGEDEEKKILDSFLTYLKDKELCDSSLQSCIFRGICMVLGFICIMNTSAISAVILSRISRNQNHSKLSAPTSRNLNIGRFVIVLSACFVIESILQFHSEYPLSLFHCKCQNNELSFVFCVLASSLLLVSAASSLGAIVWFPRMYSGITFVISAVLCHTISNFLALLIISSPPQKLCNSTMQRVMNGFVVYVATFVGALLVCVFSNGGDSEGSDNGITKDQATEKQMKGLLSNCNSSDAKTQVDEMDKDSDEENNHEQNAKNLMEKSLRYSPKASYRKSLSSRFGTVPFLPCVVLMRKKGRPFHPPAHTNIGLTSFKPPGRLAHRRASLGVIKEHNMAAEEASWARLSQRRRTSLPTAFHSTRKQAVMSSVLVETSVLAELHSTLNELLVAAASYPEIEQFTSRFQTLLKPYKSENLRPSQVVWLHDSVSSTSDGSDDEDHCRGSRISSKRLANRRADWSNSDGSVWTTTTSATGLPSQDPGPVKSKRIPKIQKTPSNTPQDSRCNSPVCAKEILGRRRTIHSTIPLHTSHVRSQAFFASEESTGTNSEPKDSKKTFPSSDYESGDNPLTGSECDSRHGSERVRGQTEPGQPARRTSTEESDQVQKIRMLITEPTIDEDSEEEDPGGTDSCHSNSTHSRQSSVGELNIPEITVVEESPFAEAQECFGETDYKGKVLEKVHSWNFPIFELACETHCVLSQMAYKLFDDTGLFESFKIPRKAFVNYMMTLENGYRNIPYHNRIHASDVLHGCWFLTTQQIPGFKEVSPLFSSDSSDSDSGTSHTQVNSADNGSLAQAIPALELMALYLAAAMHDYDHPGRTNAFLVETRHPLAMLYNDRSVLENHHASASWELLHSRNDDSFDFLVNLNIAEWKRLRFLIVEAILATDLKKHFELMARFSSKLSRRNEASSEATDSARHEGCLKWTADEDRLLVCQMVIKLADISGPTKVRDLHVTWTRSICDEFFMQGDEERSLGYPLSHFMDRDKPQVAQLQRTFIKNLIAPLVCKMHQAGILAGYSDEEEEHQDEENILEPLDDGLTHTSKTQSLLKEQLADNLRYWHSIAQLEMSGHDEMHHVFQCAHEVRLVHASKSPPEKDTAGNPHGENPSNKPLNNNPAVNYDEAEKLIVTSSKERHKDFLPQNAETKKLPGILCNNVE